MFHKETLYYTELEKHTKVMKLLYKYTNLNQHFNVEPKTTFRYV